MPNPSNGAFELNANDDIQSVSIYDNLGRLVHSERTQGKHVNLNLQLPAGFYSLKASMRTGTTSTKLVIE